MLIMLLCVTLSEPATSTKAATPGASEKTVSLFDGTLANWKESTFGGQGLVETIPAAEDDADAPILRLGSGDPLTGLKYVGPIDGDGEDPAAARTADPTDAPAIPRNNYVLRWQARRTLGDDFFCSALFPVDEAVCSVVVGGWGGGVIGLSSLDGMDASENITTNFQLFDDSVWYDFALTVTDEKIVLAIDGDEMFEVAPADYTISTRIEMEPLTPLGFATYLSTGELRNITIERQ